jgi:hypothetical protein
MNIGEAMLESTNGSGKRIGIFRQYAGYRGTHVFIANQIASATITTTIAPQTTGVIFFELPLRGESFGAWL